MLSDLYTLSKSQVISYATQFLEEHQIQDANEIVSRLSAFELCHGRPRFLAFILDLYMESRDVDFAIGKFVTEISSLTGNLFPLRFLKEDLDKNTLSLNRPLAGDQIGRGIRSGLLELIMRGGNSHC